MSEKAAKKTKKQKKQKNGKNRKKMKKDENRCGFDEQAFGAQNFFVSFPFFSFLFVDFRPLNANSTCFWCFFVLLFTVASFPSLKKPGGVL